MKKILLTLIQLVVTIGVLYWVFHDPAKRAQMLEALRPADYRWIAAAIFAYVIVEVAAAIRWRMLLQVQGIHLGIFRLAGLFLIGMFYNQFLPGGTGGDIIKSYLLLKETPGKKTGALLAVVFDRLIGLIGLISITGALIALRYDWLTTTPETKRLVWGLLVVLGSAVLALVTSFVISGFKLLDKLPAHFPMRAKVDRTFRRLSSLRASLADDTRRLRRFARRASRYLRDFSLRRLRLSRARFRSSISSPSCRSNARSRRCRSVSPASVCARKFSR